MTGPNHPDDELLECERVLELIPTFVDGETSEALAAQVRQHLMGCPGCRMAAQEETNLKQWFEPLAGEAGRADIEVPAGFAARVTAMAFADETGDEFAAAAGESTDPVMPARALAAVGHERRGPRALAPSRPQESRSDARGFLVGLTAAAAVLMVTFTLMLAQGDRVDVGDGTLSADTPLEEALRKLDEQNKAELEALERAAAEASDPQAAEQGSSAVDQPREPDSEDDAR
ncbi:MAG: zf-HC2 domain-containing protein [Planctomycetota bacterium]